ncbi:tRNA dihydrouridine synthase [Stutzerimonas kirkiae]|uniref:tRNA dihydrouridine synthase n=1 Tax=Stutzerimonas kirkiae TaxID=2211392 RepID=UPI0010383929|nr:tRNA-dihydrouridine synthase [Stutzerimonas kirkiae]TBV11418.1 tRNA dihydrouridine(16) synthase DusC [Stutzerimonas kirkiae]
MQIALAPMEGLVDEILRDLLTRCGGIDWCVTEFVRVCDRLLPASSFHKLAPELRRGSLTAAGVPLRLQLLGSDPACLADNAAYACSIGATAIDLNFGCPAKTVNKSRGGAILLNEPELLWRILREVRGAVPAAIPVTAKMRLGFSSTDGTLECARALVDGGAQQLVVHARTKVDGYKPPAHWEWVARVQEVVTVPVYANGEVWSLEDWQRCRSVSGVDNVMLGRGLVSRPDLARQIAAWREGLEFSPMGWKELKPLLEDFWRQARDKVAPRYAPGRLKQWLALLTRNYPEAKRLFDELRRENDCERIDILLARA